MQTQPFENKGTDTYSRVRLTRLVDSIQPFSGANTYWRVANIRQSDRIVSYVIIDTAKQLFEVEKDELKRAIQNKEVSVLNLALSSTKHLIPRGFGSYMTIYRADIRRGTTENTEPSELSPFVLRGNEYYYTAITTLIKGLNPIPEGTYQSIATVNNLAFVPLGYILIDEQKNLFEISLDALKQALHSNKITVINLSFAKGDRLFFSRSYPHIPIVKGYVPKKNCKS